MTEPQLTEPRTADTSWRARLSSWLLVCMEAGVLILLLVPRWLLASRRDVLNSVQYGLIAGLLVLWGVRVLLDGRLTWRKCPVSLCLAALVLLGVWELLPWPRP